MRSTEFMNESVILAHFYITGWIWELGVTKTLDYFKTAYMRIYLEILYLTVKNGTSV